MIRTTLALKGCNCVGKRTCFANLINLPENYQTLHKAKIACLSCAWREKVCLLVSFDIMRKTVVICHSLSFEVANKDSVSKRVAMTVASAIQLDFSTGVCLNFDGRTTKPKSIAAIDSQNSLLFPRIIPSHSPSSYTCDSTLEEVIKKKAECRVELYSLCLRWVSL